MIGRPNIWIAWLFGRRRVLWRASESRVCWSICAWIVITSAEAPTSLKGFSQSRMQHNLEGGRLLKKQAKQLVAP